MRCNDELRRRIGPLVDGELGAAEREELVAHLSDCPDCAGYRGELTRLRRELQGTREAAPASLARRVRTSLAMEAAEGGVGAALPAPDWTATVRSWLGRYLHAYYRPALVMLLVALLSASAGLWWAGRALDQQALAHDVLAAHMRSLLQDNAVQVASLDTHTVKPWFAGRLDYTPVVKDLAAEGFKLVGGRLDYVDGRRVAALVYMRRLHKISVFIWPAKSDIAMTAHQRIDGYNIVSWTAANMTFWAISDLDDHELGQLPDLL
ncbi:MAG: anti-sigma factor [Parvibaculaceae bacterium]